MTIEKALLLREFPFSRQEINRPDTLCFGVVKEKVLVTPLTCVQPILMFPDNPTGSACQSHDIFLRRVIGDGNFGDVKDDQDRFYLSTGHKNTFEFATCATAGVLKFAGISTKPSLGLHTGDPEITEGIDCAHRGYCARPNSLCPPEIMTCDEDETCITLYGLSFASSRVVTDDNGRETRRVDRADGSCYLQDKRRLHPSDVSGSDLAPCYDALDASATCFGDIPVTCLNAIAAWHYGLGLVEDVTAVEQCHTLYGELHYYEEQTAEPM